MFEFFVRNSQLIKDSIMFKIIRAKGFGFLLIAKVCWLQKLLLNI